MRCQRAGRSQSEQSAINAAVGWSTLATVLLFGPVALDARLREKRLYVEDKVDGLASPPSGWQSDEQADNTTILRFSVRAGLGI